MDSFRSRSRSVNESKWQISLQIILICFFIFCSYSILHHYSETFSLQVNEIQCFWQGQLRLIREQNLGKSIKAARRWRKLVELYLMYLIFVACKNLLLTNKKRPLKIAYRNFGVLNQIDHKSLLKMCLLFPAMDFLCISLLLRFINSLSDFLSSFLTYSKCGIKRI